MLAECVIRKILGNFDALKPVIIELSKDEDLFARGLDSFGSVQLMLALEEHFNIEFPDHLLNRRSFSTIRIIQDTVATLTGGVAA